MGKWGHRYRNVSEHNCARVRVSLGALVCIKSAGPNKRGLFILRCFIDSPLLHTELSIVTQCHSKHTHTHTHTSTQGHTCTCGVRGHCSDRRGTFLNVSGFDCGQQTVCVRESERERVQVIVLLYSNTVHVTLPWLPHDFL